MEFKQPRKVVGMDTKVMLEILRELERELTNRDLNGFNHLFGMDTTNKLRGLISRLGCMPAGVTEDKILLVFNTELGNILDAAGSLARNPVHDDPKSLRAMLQVIDRINTMGSRGMFNDPNHRLTITSNKIKDWITKDITALERVVANTPT